MHHRIIHTSRFLAGTLAIGVMLGTLCVVPMTAFGTTTPTGDGIGMLLLSPEIPLITTKMFDGSEGSMKELMNAFLSIAIVLSAILAVIMVAVGGFKYMTTDSVFAISGAKEQIANAIMGLLVVIMAILILWTINPQIVNLKLFQSAQYGTT